MNSLTLTVAQDIGPLQKLFFGENGASSLAQESDKVFFWILWFGIIWFIVLMGLMIFWCIKYRRRPGVPAQRSAHHNTKLELAWTILPSVFLGAMFYYGFHGYITKLVAPSNAEMVDVMGQKWDWVITYNNGAVPPEKTQIGGKMDAPIIYVPLGRPIKFRITSKDVLHSFWIPDFRFKFDAMPNRYTSFWIEAEELGDHWIFCAEYCGDYHSEMAAMLRVVPAAEYDALKTEWYAKQNSGTPWQRGKMLVETKGGCIACHSVNGAPGVGPTWDNAWGYEVALADGSKIPADDADAWDNYAHESIVNPNAKIHSGYPSPSPMSSYAGTFSDQEVGYIVAYLRHLSDKGRALEPAEGEAAPAEGE